MSDQDQKTNSNSTIILETPPMPDLPSQEVGDFLANAETSNLSSKVMFAESLLDLLVKDYSFHDFMREILVLIMKLIKCEAGSLLEVDETKNVLFFRA
ncbi:MAG: hypothetical protein HY843_06585, partial [Bdellovibrio sp.]|nr:hypothetical protein [Bdellovibrio sp.]